MTLAAVFRPEAQTDLLQTRDWYEAQQLGLGQAFSVAVDEAVIRIVAMPQMYAVVFRNVHRGKLRTFPYLIYYRVLSDRIEVIAVLHGSRDPRLWQERAN
ncbi:MAG TPA: type II toxin-antitoxin system RelE/ParE family toxin [Pyrinomonadaceae bacterium]|nr:type II toxin-antitoxin system RelE/ParE family toxin [Pyrinomonadaceae bacterium]